jgi:hypothetical protein
MFIVSDEVWERDLARDALCALEVTASASGAQWSAFRAHSVLQLARVRFRPDVRVEVHPAAAAKATASKFAPSAGALEDSKDRDSNPQPSTRESVPPATVHAVEIPEVD